MPSGRRGSLRASVVYGVGIASLLGAMGNVAHGAVVTNISPSGTDLFQGATVDSNSATFGGSDNAKALFDADPPTYPDGTTPNVEQGHLIFSDNYTSEYVAFNTSSPITLSEINLFNHSDDGTGTGNRSIATFKLYALSSPNTGSTPVGGSAGTTLLVSDNATTGTLSNNASGGTNGGNEYFFPTATAQYFEVDFTSGQTGNQSGQYDGPRIVELDAFNVPEPGSAAIIGLSAIGLLRRRRRSSAH